MTKNILSKTLGKVPQRYVLAMMGFFGVANAYIMRGCLSIAITQMVKKPATDDFNSTDPDTCPYPSDYNPGHDGNSTIKDHGYDWDEATQGVILSAFYYGYIFTHIPGGLLAQRYGGKHTLGLGILSTGIFTMMTPWVADMGATAMVVLRICMGLGEGTTFPALSTLLAQWSPPLERSQLSTVVFAGVQIGSVVSSAGGGFILQNHSWAWVFYIFGGLGILWFVVWCFLCYNDPSSHPFISDEELQYLKESIGETARRDDLGGTPWGAILTSAPVWATIIGEVGHDFGLFAIVTDLPKYMNDVMHFSISDNGILSAMPYLVMWVASIILGYAADKLLAKKVVGLTRLRKILATFGAVGPAIGCILASYAGCNKIAVSILFTVGMGFMGFCYASLRVNSLDLSPNFAGTIMALANGLGSISGMVAPTLIGYLTPNRTLAEWRIVFWVMFAVLVLSNFVFIFWGSGEVQPWNDPSADDVERLPEKRRKSTLSGGEPIREKYKNRGLPS
ncbi:sodium:phosphate symporter activity [Nesidiocoris tenuis]|uniref:Sodium:phosphate symporter activity n=1 Tax=Nesidiocoris tenuis TaxID=355587 RepID=A0ABN7B1G2_9HEMI|nr:sodium:phosphate symporter activity [Nesidiocoris tenuis]